MTQALVNIQKRDRIAFVTMNRPDKRNALNVALIEQLHDAATLLRKDGEIDAVVLGGLKKGFSAGADRGEQRIFSPEQPLREHWMTFDGAAEAVKAWESLPQITIAAIERFVIGGGFTFAMACDFRVMGRGAYISIPEVPLGFQYVWNSIPRIVSMIGASRAKRAVILGEKISAERAEQWGLVDYVTEDGMTDAFAADLAAMVVRLPRPLASQFTKRAINAITTAQNQVASHADAAQIMLLMRS